MIKYFDSFIQTAFLLSNNYFAGSLNDSRWVCIGGRGFQPVVRSGIIQENIFATYSVIKEIQKFLLGDILFIIRLF